MSQPSPTTPRSLVQVSPTYLCFRLAPHTQPGCPLAVRNDSNVSVAFKVKTTEPRRYLVRPNQGLVKAKTTANVNVFLIEKECTELAKIFQGSTSTDKFLVQTVAVGEGDHARISALSSTSQSQELSQLWSRAAKADIRNKKLAVQFLPSSERELPSQEKTPPRASPARSGAGGGATPGKDAAAFTSPEQATPVMGGAGRSGAAHRDGVERGSRAGQMSLAEERKELENKYDDLVNYTASLTEERDELNNALEDAKKLLQREMATRIALSSKGQHAPGKAGLTSHRRRTGSRTSSYQSGEDRGFSRLTLVVVAFVFFILGQWLDMSGRIRDRAVEDRSENERPLIPAAEIQPQGDDKRSMHDTL